MNDATGKRLRWHCRRGMQELDLLLIHWLDQRWPAASSLQRDAFERFLELPDPEIEQYLLKGAIPAAPEFAALAHEVRSLAANARAARLR